jgi:hypothetical protein
MLLTADCGKAIFGESFQMLALSALRSDPNLGRDPGIKNDLSISASDSYS